MEDLVSVFMSPSDRVAQLYPQAPGSLAGLRWRYYNTPPHGIVKIYRIVFKVLNFEYTVSQ
jgi:hypothetical protein